MNREWIVGYGVYTLTHKARHHDLRGPAGGGMMLHRRHFAAFTEGHAQRLDRRRAERVEQHVVGPRADHLARLTDGLGGERCRHGIVAVEATPEAPAEEISAHNDLVLAD